MSAKQLVQTASSSTEGCCDAKAAAQAPQLLGAPSQWRAAGPTACGQARGQQRRWVSQVQKYNVFLFTSSLLQSLCEQLAEHRTPVFRNTRLLPDPEELRLMSWNPRCSKCQTIHAEIITRDSLSLRACDMLSLGMISDQSLAHSTLLTMGWATSSGRLLAAATRLLTCTCPVVQAP